MALGASEDQFDRSATSNKGKVGVAFVEYAKRGGISTAQYSTRSAKSSRAIPGPNHGGPGVGWPAYRQADQHGGARRGFRRPDPASIRPVKRYLDSLGIAGVEELRSDLIVSKPEINIRVDRERANREGINTGQIGSRIPHCHPRQGSLQVPRGQRRNPDQPTPPAGPARQHQCGGKPQRDLPRYEHGRRTALGADVGPGRDPLRQHLRRHPPQEPGADRDHLVQPAQRIPEPAGPGSGQGGAGGEQLPGGRRRDHRHGRRTGRAAGGLGFSRALADDLPDDCPADPDRAVQLRRQDTDHPDRGVISPSSACCSAWPSSIWISPSS